MASSVTIASIVLRNVDGLKHVKVVPKCLMYISIRTKALLEHAKIPDHNFHTGQLVCISLDLPVISSFQELLTHSLLPAFVFIGTWVGVWMGSTCLCVHGTGEGHCL